MNALIVFEEVPDNTKLVVLHNVNADTIKKLTEWHGHYINASTDEISAEMNEFFYPGHGHFVFEKNVVVGPMIACVFDIVVVCGIIL